MALVFPRQRIYNVLTREVRHLGCRRVGSGSSHRRRLRSELRSKFDDLTYYRYGQGGDLFGGVEFRIVVVI